MKNWTIKEAVEEINKGNQEAIDEVAKHYPLAFMAIARNDLAGLSQLMGDKFTMNRLAKQVAEAEVEDDGVTSPSTATKETEATSDGDLESMTTKQLMQLCDKRGIKVPHYGKNKQFYLDALQNAGGEEAEVEDDGEEAVDDPYEGKSAMELYKLAKKRGLKVGPKKSAKYYIGLLTEADEAEAEDAAEEFDDEDWGEPDENPKKEEKKATKKAPAKKTDKAAKKEEPEEEDDGDDWDI